MRVPLRIPGRRSRSPRSWARSTSREFLFFALACSWLCFLSVDIIADLFDIALDLLFASFAFGGIGGAVWFQFFLRFADLILHCTDLVLQLENLLRQRLDAFAFFFCLGAP